MKYCPWMDECMQYEKDWENAEKYVYLQYVMMQGKVIQWVQECETEEKRSEKMKNERLRSLEEKRVAEETHLGSVPHQFSSGRPMPVEMSS